MSQVPLVTESVTAHEALSQRDRKHAHRVGDVAWSIV
jgi:hypothetical protein